MPGIAPRSQPWVFRRSSPGPTRRPEPFRDAEEAWFWTMAALTARREGARYTANQDPMGVKQGLS